MMTTHLLGRLISRRQVCGARVLLFGSLHCCNILSVFILSEEHVDHAPRTNRGVQVGSQKDWLTLVLHVADDLLHCCCPALEAT